MSFLLNKLYIVIFIKTVFVSSRHYKDVPIQLVGEDHKGYLATFINGEWKYSSVQLWDYRNSKVVCRQLGYNKLVFGSNISNHDTKNAKAYKFYGSRFICEGNEKLLSHCKEKYINSQVFNHFYKSDSPVYITCSNIKELVPTKRKQRNKKTQFRLKQKHGYSTLHSGILQTLSKDQWTDLCVNHWNNKNSHVACSELGYSNFESSYELHSNDEMYGNRGVNCSGNESTFEQCYHELNQSQQCSTVYLTCKQLKEKLPFDEQGALRLRGGYRPSEGRVEIFYNDKWGTICDDQWSIKNADVVCQQLGYKSASEAIHWADLGMGLGSIHFTNVKCTGNETNLTECEMEHENDTCTHVEDAGVRCETSTWDVQRNEIRLAGSRNKHMGRVEVLQNERWYAICGIGFTQREGQVACRQLGLGFVKRGFKTYKFGVNYQKAMYNVKCQGNETDIRDCRYTTYGRCRYYDMASVVCTKYAPDVVMDISTFEKSIKVESHTLKELRCSFEEHCLAPIVDQLYYQSLHYTRHLLKFTSRFLNVGAVTFRPHNEKDEWEWHKCHQHYHSMEVFAVYELIDGDGRPVATGHKASFCLEDSECDAGYNKVYNCTDKGDQGISVNCADNYKNTIDCQWIDITEVRDGNYSLSVSVNQYRDVAESDYLNNRAVCEVNYFNKEVSVNHCNAEPCYQESYGGNSFGHCCHFPFIYNGEKQYSCITSQSRRSWCATTFDYPRDQKWGYCEELVAIS